MTTAVNIQRTDAAARRADLARIHIAVHDLRWSDDEYRAALLAQTGKMSAGELDAAGRSAFLGYLERCGWKPAKGRNKPFRPYTQADKIQYLWRQLNDIGALRSESTDKALLAFCGRVTGLGVSHIRFLPPRAASDVLEALKAWLKRAQQQQPPAKTE